MCLAVTNVVTPMRRLAANANEDDDDHISNDTNILLYGAGALLLLVSTLAAVGNKCREARSESNADIGFEQDFDNFSAFSIPSVASAYSTNIPGYATQPIGYY